LHCVFCLFCRSRSRPPPISPNCLTTHCSSLTPISSPRLWRFTTCVSDPDFGCFSGRVPFRNRGGGCVDGVCVCWRWLLFVQQLNVKHEPLSLIPPQFVCPLPPLNPAVFPPQMREPPPPALDLVRFLSNPFGPWEVCLTVGVWGHSLIWMSTSRQRGSALPSLPTSVPMTTWSSM
jgi:hypothetical protein